MELLAPAGSYEALIAAVQSGADAVYMGFGAFNARRGAKNFTDEEFASAVDYCHLRGVRVFLTLNTLLTDRELDKAADTLRKASAMGVDAVLVQDWGLLTLARETVPDLVILDVMLPDEDGYQILGRLRETAATRTVPVIMVTAKTSEIDVVKGLDHGADDYLCKPFGIMEFISRVKAVLRRASTAPASTTTLRFGDITLDDVARTVTVDGEPVELTFKEYSLLHFFLEHPEEVLARERIMKAVWDTDDLLESRTIDMHVRTLRQKLGHAGDAICTVRKVGYKLSAKGTEAGEDA